MNLRMARASRTSTIVTLDEVPTMLMERENVERGKAKWRNGSKVRGNGEIALRFRGGAELRAVRVSVYSDIFQTQTC